MSNHSPSHFRTCPCATFGNFHAFSHVCSPCPGTYGDRPSGVIKRDSEAQDVGRGEHKLSRNTGSGGGSRTALSPNPDRSERGGREREHERDGHAPPRRRDSERGREPANGGGSHRKRSLAHPDGGDDRSSSDRRECKHPSDSLSFFLFVLRQRAALPRSFFAPRFFIPSTDPPTFFFLLFLFTLLPRRSRRVPRGRLRDTFTPHTPFQRHPHSKKMTLLTCPLQTHRVLCFVSYEPKGDQER